MFKDTGNLNAGSNLSIAIYCYTGITRYEVKDTNPRYSSLNGLIYSKDGKALTAVHGPLQRRHGDPRGNGTLAAGGHVGRRGQHRGRASEGLPRRHPPRLSGIY